MAACRTVKRKQKLYKNQSDTPRSAYPSLPAGPGAQTVSAVVQHRTGTPSMAALALLVDFLGQSCEAKKAVEDLGRDAFNDVKGSRPNKALKSQR